MVIILSLREHSLFFVYLKTLLSNIRDMIDRTTSKHRYNSPKASRKTVIHATFASLASFLTVHVINVIVGIVIEK